MRARESEAGLLNEKYRGTGIDVTSRPPNNDEANYYEQQAARHQSR